MFEVARDTREQLGWTFRKTKYCGGTVTRTLDTGDYSLVGYEHLFRIERKGSPAEWATNVFEDRFERELCRLDQFKHAYIFLEFDWAHLERFPADSGIPKSRWRYLRTTPPLLMKRTHEIQIAHPSVRIQFVGACGQAVALSLFKRIVEACPPPTSSSSS